ncbi:hypothetical protein F511_39976 [Dorcoceras hygrometricum]|uniref:Uncharacterized protein n=1 Tax=Dorcoceras hygrometricum TaxID=472368 RepID=A0A2Z7ATZ8_9LAMI|nr:hypothetical protein F511_39976 [Dorcoceras hygrometricum]
MSVLNDQPVQRPITRSVSKGHNKLASEPVVMGDFQAFQQQITSLFNLFKADKEDQERRQQDLNKRLEELTCQRAMSRNNSEDSGRASDSRTKERRQSGDSNLFILKYSRLDFPTYDGSTDPLSWIRQCEHFFRHQCTPQDQRASSLTSEQEVEIFISELQEHIAIG